MILLLFLLPILTFAQEPNSSLQNIESISNSQITVIDSNTVIILDSTDNLKKEVFLVTPDSTQENPIQTNIPVNMPTRFTNKGDGVFSVNQIFDALIKAYPTIVKPVSASNNPYYPELAINIRGTNFYNINGRFLPASTIADWEKYSPNSFYIYSRDIPNPRTRTRAENQELRRQSTKSYRKNKKRSHHKFYEALYGMGSISDTNTQIIKTRFLRRQVLIHQTAYKALKQVEKEIYSLTNNPQHSREINNFLREADTVYSFYWRTIAGSQSRSLHSYGVAIDVFHSTTKKSLYWLWQQNQKIDWVTEPISRRWNPPMTIVNIFEKYGFLWGGKWTFYDTMHYEYRPEILILNGFNVVLMP